MSTKDKIFDKYQKSYENDVERKYWAGVLLGLVANVDSAKSAKLFPSKVAEGFRVGLRLQSLGLA